MLEKIKKKLHQHPFLKNIMVLISGNVLGYAINLLTLPIISRVFSPMEMGEYDLILSSGRFVMDVISLGLLIAIMLPKSDKDAKLICKLILILNIGSLVSLLFIFGGISKQYHLFDTSISYGTALLLLALYIFTYNMQNLFYSYTNRMKLYRVLFWNPLLLSISNVGVSLILGVLGFGTAGYLGGTIVSYIICILHMRRKVNPFSEKITFHDCKKILIHYKEIVTVQLPANIISQVGNEIPTQYLGRVFGAAMLGGYSMAIKILSIPVSLLSVPVNRVVYQTMAEKANKKEPVGDFVFGILEKNIKLALLPVGLLIVLGEKIIPWILGQAWAPAGEYIAILGIMYLLKFCSACVSGTFVVMKYQKLSLWMSFINLAKFGICFGWAYMMNYGVLYTIVIYAIIECLYQFLNLMLCVYCTKYSMKKFAWFSLKYIIGGNALIYALYYVIHFII